MIVLPGGCLVLHLRDNQAMIQELQNFEQEGKLVPFVRRQLPQSAVY